MTLKNLMTTTALSLLLATSVAAQTAAPADGTATAPVATDGMTDADSMAPQSLSEMTVGDLNGTDVMDANGDSIGAITDVVQGAGEGEAIVGIGGFLGIGQYDVALPLSDLSYNPADEVISVTLTREQLEAMPEYDGANMEPLPAETQLSTLMADAADTTSPATSAPVTDTPAADAPAADAPETDAPAADAPAADEPATDAPETDAPAADAPAADAPAADAPAADAPATDAPATDAPATDDTMESDTDTEENTTTD